MTISPPNSKTMKELHRHKKYLKELTETIMRFLNALDKEMRKPLSPERGKRIAKLCNDLEYANDHARYFCLGIDYRKDKKC